MGDLKTKKEYQTEGSQLSDKDIELVRIASNVNCFKWERTFTFI